MINMAKRKNREFSESRKPELVRGFFLNKLRHPRNLKK